MRCAVALALELGDDDLVDVEEAVLLEADLDERGLHPRQDVVDRAEVDVPGDRPALGALEVDLGDAVVLEHGDALLADVDARRGARASRAGAARRFGGTRRRRLVRCGAHGAASEPPPSSPSAWAWARPSPQSPPRWQCPASFGPCRRGCRGGASGGWDRWWSVVPRRPWRGSSLRLEAALERLPAVQAPAPTRCASSEPGKWQTVTPCSARGRTSTPARGRGARWIVRCENSCIASFRVPVPSARALRPVQDLRFRP